MKNKINRLHKRIAGWMLRYVARRFPDLLVEKVQDRIQHLALGIAERSVMAYLTKEGLIHCRYCAQRFNLRVIGGSHVCAQHVLKATNEQREPAAAAAR